MRRILFFIAIFFGASTTANVTAQVNVQDSLALVDFYDSTDGPNWNYLQWDFQSPVSTWSGVTLTDDRVTSLELTGVIKNGKIPSSFGNLTALTTIDFLDDKLIDSLPASFGNLVNLTSLSLDAVLYYPFPFPSCIEKLVNLKYLSMTPSNFTGPIPAFLGNLTKLEALDLSYCMLSGPIPTELGNLTNLKGLSLNSNSLTGNIPGSFGNLSSLTFLSVNENKLDGDLQILLNLNNLTLLDVEQNNFTYLGLEPVVSSLSSSVQYFTYSPQNNIAITRQNNILSVAPGGTPSNNTFKWYRQGTGLLQTINADSTYTPSEIGTYYVEVTNTVATDLTLTGEPVDFNLSLANAPIEVTTTITGTSANNIQEAFIEIATLTPGGTKPLSGNVNTAVFLDSAVNTYKGVPYVQRHYDITPANNAASSEATVTLYFLQSEFDAYNDFVTANGLGFPLLPAGGADNGNVRVSQFHGSFSGSSDPGGYADQDAVRITPTVTWDGTNNWWEVTFPVSGFSGFFVSTATSALPVSLINFTGAPADDRSLMLSWNIESAGEVAAFWIERSRNGIDFESVGKVDAENGSRTYSYQDNDPFPGISYYRLKIVGHDGKYIYSSIVQVAFSGDNQSLKLYPNPVSNVLKLTILTKKEAKLSIRINDLNGKVVLTKFFSANADVFQTDFNLAGLSRGLYYLSLEQDGKLIKRTFVKK